MEYRDKQDIWYTTNVYIELKLINLIYEFFLMFINMQYVY